MSSTEQCIRHGLNLNNFGKINLQISRLMDDPESDISDFINTIRFNSDLSTAIINIVNNSYSGFTGEINCLTRAVKLLGIGQLHHIVNCLAEPGGILPVPEILPDRTEYCEEIAYLQAG